MSNVDLSYELGITRKNRFLFTSDRYNCHCDVILKETIAWSGLKTKSTEQVLSVGIGVLKHTTTRHQTNA